LVLDGTDDAERRARLMLDWDVNNGVARRAWGRNSNAQLAISGAEKRTEGLSVTKAHHADSAVVAAALNQK
jgi:urocanate hydratase